MFSRHDSCAQSFPQNRQLAFGGASIDEFKQAQALVVSDRNHWPEWRIDPLSEQWWMRFGTCWRFAKKFRKRVTEAALRFKATPVSRLIHAVALPHLAQSKTHPACAMIRLECHPIMALELSPR